MSFFIFPNDQIAQLHKLYYVVSSSKANALEKKKHPIFSKFHSCSFFIVIQLNKNLNERIHKMIFDLLFGGGGKKKIYLRFHI